jgi:rRNA maturation endonuclease Nob1
VRLADKALIASSWWCFGCSKGTLELTKAATCPGCGHDTLLRVLVMPPGPSKPDWWEK